VSEPGHKEAVRRFLDALGRNDRQALRPIVGDNVRWWVQPSVEARGLSRPLMGWEAVPWLGGGGSTAFRPGTTHWTIHHVLEEGDLVAVHMNRQAVGANGRPYDNEYHWLFRFEEDLIVEVWEILDTAYAFAILGETPFAPQT
jgi:ketosteroid isomerase-like protein